MRDENRTKEQLVNELAELRQRVTELEALEAARKRAEEALWESEQKLGVIFHESLDVVMIVDGENGQILNISEAVRYILGYESGALIGKHFSVLFPPESELSREDLLERLRVYGAVIESQEFFRADGSVCPMDLTATLIPWGKGKAVIATLRDVTERVEQRVRERTAEIQAQYARLDTILRSTADGIVVTDVEGDVLQTNPVAQTWLSRSLSPEDAARLREAVWDLALRAGERPEMVLELTGLDLELKASPISEPRGKEAIRLGPGEPAAVVAVHNVSYLKALDRMKTRFVTNVSHELRTPVTTIKLYAHLMRQHPQKWEEYLNPLAQEADHQAQLVEDILQISRIDAGRVEMKPRPTLLNELTEAVIADYRMLAQERGLALEHHPFLAPPACGGGVGGAGPVALVDPNRMMQVLSNLVENAIYYTPEGGRVVISTGKEEAEGRVWATATVADTGIDIPEEELPHIFDRFFRGEEPRSMQISGTGLGLAIVQEIVELHGGRVTVESPLTEFTPSEAEGLRIGEEGVGSTFTVWLPLAE